MSPRVNFLLRIGGAVTLTALGGLTIFGSIPELIGVPLLLVAGILYGLEFEKAFWVVFLIAIVLMFLWLGIRLYPDYATQPTAIIIYLLVATAVIVPLAKLSVSNIRNVDAEAEALSAGLLRRAQEKREREEREATARQLVEEKNIMPRAGEPSPPWIEFPGYPFFDGLQRFGAHGPGDEYMDKEWSPFWHGLSINQRHEYFQYYDLGEQWHDRDDWYYHWVTWEKIEVYADYLEKLVSEATIVTHPGEPCPPWIKYPELADATADWRHGKGDDYLKQTFLPFFNALAIHEQQDFLRRHDLGLGWDDRDEWMSLIGSDGGATQQQ